MACFPSLILPQIDGLMNRQYLYGWHVSSLWLLGIVAYRSILTIQQWRKIFGIQEAQPHTEFQTSCCQHHQCVQVTVFIWSSPSSYLRRKHCQQVLSCAGRHPRSKKSIDDIAVKDCWRTEGWVLLLNLAGSLPLCATPPTQLQPSKPCRNRFADEKTVLP